MSKYNVNKNQNGNKKIETSIYKVGHVTLLFTIVEASPEAQQVGGAVSSANRPLTIVAPASTYLFPGLYYLYESTEKQVTLTLVCISLRSS